MFLASFFGVCKYGRADHSFRHTQFEAHEGGFIVLLPASSVEEASTVRLARLINLCGFQPALDFLAFKKGSRIDWGHYIEDFLPFLGYHLKTRAVFGSVATLKTKFPNVGGSVISDVPGRKVAWMKIASYAINKNCKLEWKHFSGEFNKKEVPGDDDVPDTDYLELPLQRIAGSTKETSAVDPLW